MTHTNSIVLVQRSNFTFYIVQSWTNPINNLKWWQAALINHVTSIFKKEHFR